jgi:membrane fusion protein (multidrug efflux system)
VDRKRIILVLFGMPLAAFRSEASDPVDVRSEQLIVLRRCFIDHERITTLGPSSFGVLKECFVEPGAQVKEGQVLGRLEDDDARADVELREIEAGSDVDIRLSENKNALAQSRLKRTTALLKRSAVSREEYTQHRLEAEATALDVENARLRHQLAEAQLRRAKAQLRGRDFVAPHDGVVTEVLRRPNEPVAPNAPVFRIVDVDHLLITGQVDVTDVWRLQTGQPVKIIPEVAGADLPVEREVFDGRLTFIDTHVDPLSQTCKVLAKFENRNRVLRTGLEARLEIPTGGMIPATAVGMNGTRRTDPAASLEERINP